MLQGGVGNLLFQYSASLYVQDQYGAKPLYSEFKSGHIDRLSTFLGVAVPRASTLRHVLSGAVGASIGARATFVVKTGRAIGIYSHRIRTDNDSVDFEGRRLSKLYVGYFQESRWHDSESVGKVVGLLEAQRREGGFEILGGVVGVHLRRGDFLGGDDNLSVAWFLQEVERIDPSRAKSVMVVGDDSLACLALEGLFRHRGWKIADPSDLTPAGCRPSGWRDFNLLACCDAVICSNSTFSWWVAALSTEISGGQSWVSFPLTDRGRWVLPGWCSDEAFTSNGQVEPEFRSEFLGCISPKV